MAIFLTKRFFTENYFSFWVNKNYFTIWGPIRGSKFNFLQKQLLNYQIERKRHQFVYSRLS